MGENILAAKDYNRGAECTFKDALKATNGSSDTGLLTCEEFETCIEDESSAAGGRCVDLLGEVANDATRSLEEACLKCQGAYYVCPPDVNLDNIGCGSCNGDFACVRLPADAVVRAGSCNGDSACFYLPPDAVVGAGSCNGDSACFYPSAGAVVGADSCNGDHTCQFLDTGVTIGENSCIGNVACYRFSGTVGDNSCASGEGRDCYSSTFAQTIGNDSCNGLLTCHISFTGAKVVGSFNKTVGDFSCNGPHACEYLYCEHEHPFPFSGCLSLVICLTS